MDKDSCDVVVVGGGPVGLYAGFRSALLLLRVQIVDRGGKWSRGFYVPRYYNIPIYSEGVAGKDIISHLRKSISLHQDYARIDDLVLIETATRCDGTFMLRGIHHPTKGERSYRSRVVVLATGVVDRQPIIGGEISTVFPYANSQLLCYCTICDGKLVKGKNAAIIGNGRTAVLTALDLTYFKAKKITILTNGEELFDDSAMSMEKPSLEKRVASEGVDVVTDEIKSLFGVENNLFGVKLSGGREMTFEIAFSAMGFHKINNDLAVMLGGKIDETGYIVVDEDCRVLAQDDKPIPGLYAVGDVTTNWNQLMTGFGDADRAILHAWGNYL